MTHVDNAAAADQDVPRPDEVRGRRPIPTLYRLPWLVLIFAPWYLKHFLGQPYRQLSWTGNLRELFTNPKRRHRIALYDGVLNLILNGYRRLSRLPVNRRDGRVAVAFTRLAFAFDDEYERRCAGGESVSFDAVFGGAQVEQPLSEWRELMRPLPTYPAVRSYLERFVRALFSDYTAGIENASHANEFDRLVHAATLDSGGFLRAVVHVVALAQCATLEDRVSAQLAALGTLGKAADDMIDFGADSAAARPNLLRALLAETPVEEEAVGAAWPAGDRMNTVWWRRNCPETFTRYLAMCAERYDALGTGWFRLACYLLWIPALLGRATTRDVRGRL